MIKNKARLSLAALLLGGSLSAMAAEQLVFSDNDTVPLTLSLNNINRLFVAGDPIIDLHAPTGYVMGNTPEEQEAIMDDAGALYLQFATATPFTLYISTKQGHHLGITVTPTKSTGKTIQLLPRTASEQAKVWEEKRGYEASLIALMTSLLQHQIPVGYGVEKVSRAPEKFGEHGELRAQLVYNGVHFKATVYRLTNQGNHPLFLQEPDFYKKGVEAVNVGVVELGYCQSTTIIIVEKAL